MSRQGSAVRNEPTSIPHWYDPNSTELTIVNGIDVRVWDDEGNDLERGLEILDESIRIAFD